MSGNWRPVSGDEGFYEVSDTGLVRSIDRIVVGQSGRLAGVRTVRHGVLLTASLRRGYPTVSLNKEGNKRRKQVHRLVLEAFVGPCPEGMQACHNDGDRTNNRVENLRWDTAQANIFDCIKHGTQAKMRVTECPAGHQYDEQNTIYRLHRTGRVHRGCRACKRDMDRRAYLRRKAGAL